MICWNRNIWPSNQTNKLPACVKAKEEKFKWCTLNGMHGHNFPPLNRFHQLTDENAEWQPTYEKKARNTTEWVRVLCYLYLIINNFILILFYYYCHNYAFRFFLCDVASWLVYRRTLFSSILLFCLPCHWNSGIIFGSKWCSRLFSSIFVVFI